MFERLSDCDIDNAEVFAQAAQDCGRDVSSDGVSIRPSVVLALIAEVREHRALEKEREANLAGTVLLYAIKEIGVRNYKSTVDCLELVHNPAWHRLRKLAGLPTYPEGEAKPELPDPPPTPHERTSALDRAIGLALDNRETDASGESRVMHDWKLGAAIVARVKHEVACLPKQVKGA